jgi:osmotically-inducible protein OsmY
MTQQFPAIPDDHWSDARLRAAILASFATDSRLANADLRVGVVNGIAHLAGAIASLPERWAAEELARQTPGVRGVVNRIEAPGAPSPGREINLDLKNEKAST